MNWEDYKSEIEKKGKLPEEWYILGIDLGTTNSVVSYWDNTAKKPEPIDISNGFGKIPLPSVVQFRKEEDGGEWVIGEEAYRSMKIYPETTIRSIKRKMGTSDTVEINEKKYLPEEITAKILMELIEHCKSMNPNAEIIGCVVSVPYDFDDAAKKATMQACHLAGLEDKLICLIEEPKAAALMYNFRHSLEQGEKIMVFDFGGGTLDITIFHVVEKDDTHIKLQVISEGGKAYHGGDNVDEIILERCIKLVEEKTGQTRETISIENLAELSMRAREAKERLTGVKSFRIPFTFCIPPFVDQITREQFEEAIAEFADNTRKLVLKALRESYKGALTPDDIDKVLLEGGSSQMPWVKDMLIGIFNDEKKLPYASDTLASDISLGATYYAAMKMGLIEAADVEDDDSVNVEFEVTVPHDVGLEISSGTKKSFFAMIKRGTPYSLAKKSHTFVLSGDNPEDMTTLDLRIVERIDKEDSIQDCKLIGEVEISDLPKRPSGKTKLQVSLSVEEEGGMVKGYVEDLGFSDLYPPSGYKFSFEPSRYKKTNVGKEE